MIISIMIGLHYDNDGYGFEDYTDDNYGDSDGDGHGDDDKLEEDEDENNDNDT